MSKGAKGRASKGTNPGTNKGTSPRANTGTNKGTNPRANTGTNTRANPRANTRANTGPNTGANTGANPVANTRANEVRYENIPLDLDGAPIQVIRNAGEAQHNTCRTICKGQKPTYKNGVENCLTKHRNPCLQYGYKPRVENDEKVNPEVRKSDIAEALGIIIRETPMKDHPDWYSKSKHYVELGTRAQDPYFVKFTHAPRCSVSDEKVINGIAGRFKQIIKDQSSLLGRMHFGRVSELVHLYNMFDEAYKERYGNPPAEIMHGVQRRVAYEYREMTKADKKARTKLGIQIYKDAEEKQRLEEERRLAEVRRLAAAEEKRLADATRELWEALERDKKENITKDRAERQKKAEEEEAKKWEWITVPEKKGHGR